MQSTPTLISSDEVEASHNYVNIFGNMGMNLVYAQVE